MTDNLEDANSSGTHWAVIYDNIMSALGLPELMQKSHIQELITRLETEISKYKYNLMDIEKDIILLYIQFLKNKLNEPD